MDIIPTIPHPPASVLLPLSNHAPLFYTPPLFYVFYFCFLYFLLFFRIFPKNILNPQFESHSFYFKEHFLAPPSIENFLKTF